MGFVFDTGVPAVTVFLQGILSFFSPCVLPLLPVYFGYLSGGTAVRQDDGKMYYNRGKVLINTLFFVAGVSFAFFLLGLGMTAVGMFFGTRQIIFARIGGVIVILLGLYQTGVFGDSMFLSRERRLSVRFDRLAVSPLTAFILGFAFSFSWTPCVGPALTGVLFMAASSRATGFLLIGLYTLGFVLPFLAAGLFTASLLELFRKHRDIVRYTVKAGGVLLILMGLLMISGRMNGFAGNFSGSPRTGDVVPLETETEENNGGATTSPDTEDMASQETDTENAASTDAETENPEHPAAFDFELTDQYGETHRLSDYRGQVVFLNFWATWCPPCRAEMPAIQSLYESCQNSPDGDYIILGVAAPGLGSEADEDGVKAFLSDNGYTYPVVMDLSGALFSMYAISAIPTTFMIDRDGNIFGYVPGSMTEEMMRSVIDQTIAG